MFQSMKNVQIPEKILGKIMPSKSQMSEFISYMTQELGINLIIRPEKVVNTNEINNIKSLDDVVNFKSIKSSLDSKTLLLFLTAIYELRSKVDKNEYVSYLKIFDRFPISYFLDEFGSGRLTLCIDDQDLLYPLIDILKDLKFYISKRYLSAV